MAQVTKFTIDPNLSGIQLRTQASEMLTALSTLNSGDLEPVNPSAGMLWLDTTKNILKIRDKTNTAWLDFAGVNDKVIAASAADSAKLGGVAADKFAKKDDIPAAPQAATETEAGIVKLKNSITGNLSDTAVSENAVKEYVAKNASIGIGQEMKDMSSQRHIGGLTSGQEKIFTNTTGRPIKIIVVADGGGAADIINICLDIDGKRVVEQQGYSGGAFANVATISEIIPSGSTYKIYSAVGGCTIRSWWELR